MTISSRIRDVNLLDALDQCPRVPVTMTVWRVVREGRDPLLCGRSLGRWDLGLFDVLYTACDADGAISELYFHLSRQPVFPSRVVFTLNEIVVRAKKALDFKDLAELARLGVDPKEYSGILYHRTQQIGDAAAFLGFDGVTAPSARWNCQDFAIFCDSLSPHDFDLQGASKIDWNDWRKTRING